MDGSFRVAELRPAAAAGITTPWRPTSARNPLKTKWLDFDAGLPGVSRFKLP
jgi:hypothetical protein